MLDGVVRDEALAGVAEALGLCAVAAFFGFIDGIKHEVREHQGAFPSLHQPTSDLGCGDIRDVVVLGDDCDVFVGQVAVIQSVADG